MIELSGNPQVEVRGEVKELTEDFDCLEGAAFSIAIWNDEEQSRLRRMIGTVRKDVFRILTKIGHG